MRRRGFVSRPRVAGLFVGGLCVAVMSGCAAPEPEPPAPRPAATVTPSLPGLPSRAQSLVGETSDALVASLGRPSLIRDEGPAEIWLYQSREGCRINLVLYRQTDGAHVAHADASTPPRTSEAACLRAIARTRADGNLS
jgi:hypothetical protein